MAALPKLSKKCGKLLIIRDAVNIPISSEATSLLPKPEWLIAYQLACKLHRIVTQAVRLGFQTLRNWILSLQMLKHFIMPITDG